MRRLARSQSERPLSAVACRRLFAFLTSFAAAACTAGPSAREVAAVQIINFDPGTTPSSAPEGRLMVEGSCLMLETADGALPLAWPPRTRVSTDGVEVPTASGDFRLYTFRDTVRLELMRLSEDALGERSDAAATCRGDEAGAVYGVLYAPALDRP